MFFGQLLAAPLLSRHSKDQAFASLRFCVEKNLPIANVFGQGELTPAENTGAAGDVFTRVGRDDGVGEEQVLRSTDQGAGGMEFSGGYGSEELGVEGDGQDEDVFDRGVYGEEGGIVEQFEIVSSVDGVGRVKQVFVDRHVDGGPAFFDRHSEVQALVAWSQAIHSFEFSKVLIRH